ncbi:hypothetical protein [Clostridium drakei]|uniref:Uncharacterized protein n=1 Tax=Clostridium drakei TaxID=332101 RepID=A0A2U8DVD5_9CLOT|nr:hypothetical protein [Clostridium drakei]AWI06733.1 hypothetical protein B9W14_20280 [Clostridium drakei]
MTIFKRVYSNCSLLSNKIKNGQGSELDQHKLEALKEIVLYFESLKYVDDPNSKIKVGMYFELVRKYNKGIYSKMTRELFRTKNKADDEEYKRYLNSVQALICYTSKNLEKKFGEAIDLIDSGDIEEGLNKFRNSTCDRKIAKGVLSLFPAAKKNENLKVKDCGAGLIFIGCFIAEILRKEIQYLDTELEYLRYVIESPDADPAEKQYVNDFLDSCAGVIPLIQTMINKKLQ